MDVRSLPLHLEITTKCLLSCPACPRSIYRNHFNQSEMSLDSVRCLNTNFLNFTIVIICGDHGDPIYHSQFHQVLTAVTGFAGLPPIRLCTNGSHKDEAWWRVTSSILRSKDRIIFGIDGLEDTAGLYRRGTDWNSVVEAIKIVKENSACMVDWQWILFRHNQHQLSDAYKMFKKLNIDNFNIVGSNRYADKIGCMRPTITLREAYEQFSGNNISAL